MRRCLLRFSVLVLFFYGCAKEKAVDTLITTRYPLDVAKIMVNKCATAGCHNSTSKDAAGGLTMETWDQLFQGGNGGSVVIPYRPDQSWLMYFINTDTSRGITLSPTMPFNEDPLSDDEYNTIKNWITAGAPNADGVIPFSGDPNRKKFYVSNQGCDLVTVFDMNSLLAMRYITVGSSDIIETPHMIRVSPDGQYWYVIFVAGTIVQKYRASDDSFVGEAEIGPGSWNTMAISSDGSKAFVVDWEDDGKIAYVDLDQMTLKQTYQGSGLFIWPHGSYLNQAFTTLYVTAQYGNFIYKIDISNPSFPQVDQVVLKPGQQANVTPGTLDPHEVMLSPDESKYFVTCNSSDEVRVMDTKTDTLITVISVGDYPVEMSMSKTHPYLFVTCMEDACSEPLCKGSVYVIDYDSLSVIKVLQSGLFQPHGVAVDDVSGNVVVSNRNLTTNGPAPHHISECGGRNGYIKIIDLNTLEFKAGYQAEVSVDPYSVAVR